MTVDEALDELDRIHDDEPDRAAAGLRALEPAGLAAGRLPLYGFLLLHVLGEKLGQWPEAADRLEALHATRPDAPLAVLAHAATAAHLAGRSSAAAFAGLAQAGGEAEATALVELGALNWRPPPSIEQFAAQLHRLAAGSERFDVNGPLNQRLAAGFNNATSALLDQSQPPVPAAVAAALNAGATAALRFWKAAGTWVNHERALYLEALVANRVGDHAGARAVCEAGLALIAENGTEEVDRTFLQLQLAGALMHLGEPVQAQAILAESRRAADQWDDAGLKSWFADEHRRLFGPAEHSA
jgi:hypothetical protein